MEVHASQPGPSAKKRERHQLSCQFCRRKKLKCDRNQPCGNCAKRGLSSSCRFTSSGSEHQASAEVTRMRSRIQHLETLVRSMMNGNHQDVNQSDMSEQRSNVAQQTNETTPCLPTDEPVGRMHRLGLQTSYFAEEHWEAVLEDIAEVKEFFEQHGDNEQRSEKNPTTKIGPELLFPDFDLPTQEDLLSSMPDRVVVDRLISRYFNSMDAFSVILHMPTFQKEYDQFWEDPMATSPMWVGLLYSIMCTATLFSLRSGPGALESLDEMKNTASLYKHRAVQCLRLTNYAQPVQYTLETLIVYLSTEYVLNRDAQLGIWLVFGIIMRLALRMGYHRDPSHYPEISAFDAEMRRRVWATLLPLDILTSGQIGLPWMVKLSLVDTETPRNLLDQDFGENNNILPLARPSSELTPVSYTIAKAKLAAVLGQISDLTSSARPIQYEEIINMDQLLLETYSSMPPGLQVRPVRNSIMDSPSLIMKRFNLDLLHQKARCILHRKFMVLAWTDLQYNDSQQSCVKAALQILQHQQTIHFETQPGGLLEADKWMVSALTTHDFLLAAMILCLDLDHRRHPQHLGPGSKETSETQESEILQALEASRHIWHASSHSSAEASRAFQVLSIMLGKLGPKTRFLPTPSQDLTETSGLPTQDTSIPPNPLAHQNQASSAFARPAIGRAPFRQPGSGRSEYNNYLTSSPERDIEGLMDLEQGIDWNWYDDALTFHVAGGTLNDSRLPDSF